MDDSFWNLPALRKALAARDIGRVFRAYRHAQESALTQGQLGEWIGLSQGQVSRIERAPVPVSDLARLEQWVVALRIPQRRLWFALSTQPPDTSNAGCESRQDPAQLRQLLTTAAAGVPGTSTASARSEMSHRHGRTVGTPDVERVRDMINGFRRQDNRYGGGHNRRAVAAYLSGEVEPLIRDGHATPRIRTELSVASAELHQLVGWMAYDTGHADEGRKHLRRALRLAQRAGNDHLAAEMLAGMSHQAAFYGAPDAAADLALAARQAANSAGLPALRAESAAMEAHALAITGDSAACIAALRDAEQSFTHHNSNDVPEWLRYFDEAYLAAKFGHTFRDLGMPREAEQFARRSLKMNEGYERGRMFNTALLASILADQNRVDEACATGAVAASLAVNVQSVRTRSYLVDLAKRLAPARADRAVRSLYQQMHTNGIPVPDGAA